MSGVPTDVGAVVKNMFSIAYGFTAGDGEDGVEQNGIFVDRQDFMSMEATVIVTATLTATETATIRIRLADATTVGGTGVAAYEDANAPDDLVLTGGGGGTTETGELSFDVNLKPANQFVRIEVTITLSKADTDVTVAGGVLTLGGPVEAPV